MCDDNIRARKGSMKETWGSHQKLNHGSSMKQENLVLGCVVLLRCIQQWTLKKRPWAPSSSLQLSLRWGREGASQELQTKPRYTAFLETHPKWKAKEAQITRSKWAHASQKSKKRHTGLLRRGLSLQMPLAGKACFACPKHCKQLNDWIFNE